MDRDWKAESDRARQSARAGRWDQVQRYYGERDGSIRDQGIDVGTAEALAAADREIESLLLVARAAARTLLEETSVTRRAAGQIRAKLSGAKAIPSSVSRRI